MRKRGSRQKPIEERRVEVIQIRMTPAEKNLIGRIAQANGVSIADLVRRTILGEGWKFLP